MNQIEVSRRPKEERIADVKDFFSSRFQSILPGSIYQEWFEAIPKWEMRWSEQSLENTITSPTKVPAQKFDRQKIKPTRDDGSDKTTDDIDLEAAKKYLGSLESWMIGGDARIAMPIAIDMSFEKISSQMETTIRLDNINIHTVHALLGMTFDVVRGKLPAQELRKTLADLLIHKEWKNSKNTELVEANLETIAGATARISWSKQKNDVEKQINSSDSDNQARLLGELKNIQDPRYRENLYVETRNEAKSRLSDLLDDPNQLYKILRATKDQAKQIWTEATGEVSTVFGREDNLYFGIKQLIGKPEYNISWTQPSIEEETLANEGAIKGVTVAFYRVRDDKIEYFLNYGKRDALSTTSHFSPAFQTSLSNIKNVLGDIGIKIFEAINFGIAKKSTTHAETGVYAAVIDLTNPNRWEDTSAAISAINWDAIEPAKQEEILATIAAGNGNKLTHEWISEDLLDQLEGMPLMDLDGILRPITTDFISKTKAAVYKAEGINIRTARLESGLLDQMIGSLTAEQISLLEEGVQPELTIDQITLFNLLIGAQKKINAEKIKKLKS